MPAGGDNAPEHSAGSVGEKEVREGRAEPAPSPEPEPQVEGWDVERVCLWARENRFPEFQAVARKEEIDGELGMRILEERATDGEPVLNCVCARKAKATADGRHSSDEEMVSRFVHRRNDTC